VQPAMKIPATMQRPRMIKMLFVVVMIFRKRFCDGCVKKRTQRLLYQIS
jgi:hypothetical protein